MSKPNFSKPPLRHKHHPTVEEIVLAEHDKGTIRVIGESDGHDIAITYGFRAEANACLFGTASEMYEMLKTYRRTFGCWEDVPDLHRQCDKLLARARGESSA